MGRMLSQPPPGRNARPRGYVDRLAAIARSELPIGSPVVAMANRSLEVSTHNMLFTSGAGTCMSPFVLPIKLLALRTA